MTTESSLSEERAFISMSLARTYLASCFREEYSMLSASTEQGGQIFSPNRDFRLAGESCQRQWPERQIQSKLSLPCRDPHHLQVNQVRIQQQRRIIDGIAHSLSSLESLDGTRP